MLDRFRQSLVGTVGEEPFRRVETLRNEAARAMGEHRAASDLKIESDVATFNFELLMLDAGLSGPIRQQTKGMMWGPRVEVVLTDSANGQGRAIDFRTGQLLTIPDEVRTKMPHFAD
ncbi:MAG: hypothetical protein ACYC26_10290 [Phycisphaerales bacterium]